MINQDKWISSLPKVNKKFDEKSNQTDHYRWINTIPKKDKYNSIKRYSIVTILFAFGFLFVSAVKNETRNLERKINNLKASNNEIKFNLNQAILDNEVITSPENISRLAKEYLNTNFATYKKSQIKKLNDNSTVIKKISKKKDDNNELSKNIKLEIKKKIKKTKVEIAKLQELYSKPEEIPDEVKTQVAKKIEEKKIILKKLYASPKEVITLEKAQKWAAVQVVKVFLGMPVIPGK